VLAARSTGLLRAWLRPGAPVPASSSAQRPGEKGSRDRRQPREALGVLHSGDSVVASVLEPRSATGSAGLAGTSAPS
jgi:hypothetical protein